jgi:asparagine synthase (glutamine-hydrolysing)
LADSPDLKAARVMADYLKSIHHEVVFTIDEALAFLPEAVRCLETYDITTIRAGLPMLIMMRQISRDGFKVVLSGEGSDEEWAGYVYNAKAPNPLELYEESVRKMDDLHWYDCRRANMAGAAYGVEVRVPFLDRSVVDYVMSVDPKVKMHSTIRMIDDKTGDIHRSTIEKRHLREAFEHILPASIAWRGKEQFSDGVGYSWINTLKKVAESKYSSDLEMATAFQKYNVNTPLTKEGLWYREIFEQHFQDKAILCCPNQKSIACSSPKALEWNELWKAKHDPSGRI